MKLCVWYDEWFSSNRFIHRQSTDGGQKAQNKQRRCWQGYFYIERWKWFWELLDAQLNLKVSTTSQYLGLNSDRGLRNKKGQQAVSKRLWKAKDEIQDGLCGRRDVRSSIRTKADEVELKETPVWNKVRLWKRLLRSWVFYFSCSKMFNREETSEWIQRKDSRI